MTALDPVLPRLEQLVPRLGSSHDAEVVAAVHAIARTLAGAGLDWHDLTAALRPPARPAPEPPPRAQSRAQPHTEDLRSVANWCAMRLGLLDRRQSDFVVQMAVQLHRGRTISPKQRQWLFDIRDGLLARTAEEF